MPPGTTIIVASTPAPTLGIGQSLRIPWRISADLLYFARVTKNCPPSKCNAVIMGRKTYESIPPRFRPLPDRINIVLSRTPHFPTSSSGGLSTSLPLNSPTIAVPAPPPPTPSNPPADLSYPPLTPTSTASHLERGSARNVVYATSLDSAISILQTDYPELHRIFIIGGSEIYRAALSLPPSSGAYPHTILHTEVLEPSFECDTFFPNMFTPSSTSPSDVGGTWEKKSVDELIEYTGEEADAVTGVKEDKGVKFRFSMRKRS